MKIQFSPTPPQPWVDPVVDLPAAPREGDEVTFGDGSAGRVRRVVWYPEGSKFEGGDQEPFVYVVVRMIGSPRAVSTTEETGR